MRLLSSFVLAFCTLNSEFVFAAAHKELPLWEIGAVLGAGLLPNYLASDQNRWEVVPLPYFSYRGQVVRSDEKGLLRGRLFKSANLELDISLAGAISTDSSNNQIRNGMPDLDWMGELGPRLEITLAKLKQDSKIELEIPLRAVFSTDFRSLGYVGMITVPEIVYQHDNLGVDKTRIKLGIGIMMADRLYQETFYGVSSLYVSANRPAYRATGGYMGTRIQAVVSYPVTPALSIIGAVRGSFQSGAANSSSSLFRRNTNGSLGLAVVWSMIQSRKTVAD